MAHVTSVELPGVLPVVDACSKLEATRQRWQVLYQQLRSGCEPCYRTERRLTCAKHDCPWRDSCVALRAEWQR